MGRSPLLPLGFVLSWPALTVFTGTYLVSWFILAACARVPELCAVLFVVVLMDFVSRALRGTMRGQSYLAPWRDLLVSGIAMLAASSSLLLCGVSLPREMLAVLVREPRAAILALSAFAFFVARWMPFLYRALLRINASRCTFVLFRPFSSLISQRTRLVVAPTFGAYGRVRLVADAGLDAALPETTLDVDTDLLIDFSHQMVAGQGDWRPNVKLLIDTADFAVVDVSAYSESVEWEVRESLRVLDRSRILFVASDGNAAVEWRELTRASRERRGTIRRPLSYSSSWSFRFQVFGWLWSHRRAPRKRSRSAS